LIEQSRGAGLEIELSVEGQPRDLALGVDLSAFRIIQEALTNVIKHAPGAPATARLVVSATEVTLAVDSLGAPGHGTGHGVDDMRERAESLGGSCEAGPEGAGWLVRATFPLAIPEVAP
jgi:signal transduction histidine kinase